MDFIKARLCILFLRANTRYIISKFTNPTSNKLSDIGVHRDNLTEFVAFDYSLDISLKGSSKLWSFGQLRSVRATHIVTIQTDIPISYI